MPALVSGTDSTPAYVIYAVVPATGRLHKRYLIEGRMVDDGRCGTDDNWITVDAIPEDVSPDLLCSWCWPKGD